MDKLTLVIPGVPIAKKRPRFVRRGKFVNTYNCQETEEGKFMLLCKSQLSGMEPIPKDKGVNLHCDFVMPIPAGWSKKKLLELAADGVQHVKKPDADNLIKFVKDCLNGLAWHDDSQVVYLTAEKFYGANPRTEITVEW